MVDKVQVSCNPQFTNPLHEIPLDGPIKPCKQYGMNYLFIYEMDIGAFVCIVFDVLLSVYHRILFNFNWIF